MKGCAILASNASGIRKRSMKNRAETMAGREKKARRVSRKAVANSAPAAACSSTRGKMRPCQAANSIIRTASSRASIADVEGLVLLGESQDVESVGSDVVGGAAEGHQPEEAQGAAQPPRRIEGEGHAGQRSAHQQLHHHNPPALRAQGIHQRTPQRFDDPRQIEPAGVERQCGIRQAKVGVHDDGERHDCHIGHGLGKVKCGNPKGGREPLPLVLRLKGGSKVLLMLCAGWVVHLLLSLTVSEMPGGGRVSIRRPVP